jgi:hypothetical protein
LFKIPFDSPIDEPVDLDFSEIAAPYYVKSGFKASILCEDSLPYEACCSIYSPKNVVTIVIILKKRYENDFKAWLNGNTQFLDSCCLRRELYCHEACHLIAIIRAFPGDRSSRIQEDFKTKIKEKFAKSVNSAKEQKAVPLVSIEQPGDSPSVFDKDHFRYGNDDLSYFRLYQELMFSHDKMISTLQKLCKNTKGDVTKITFFKIFPEKLTAFRKLLLEEMGKEEMRN